MFKKFQLQVERYFNTKNSSVQTYWGGEFRPFNTFFSQLGIIHRLPCPYIHQQNGCIERKHRHIIEIALSFFLLIVLFLLLFGMMHVSLLVTSLIDFLPQPSRISLFFRNSSIVTLTILFSRYLVALVTLTFVLTIATNSNSALFPVSSLVIVPITKVISAYIFPLVGCISPVMLFLMSSLFPLLKKILFHPPLPPQNLHLLLPMYYCLCH